MSKKKKVWVFKMSWDVYDEADSEVFLFSSLTKAQAEMTKAIRDDLIKSINFDHFEYDEKSDTIEDKIPFELFNDKILKSKRALFYNDYDSFYISYEIEKMPIK